MNILLCGCMGRMGRAVTAAATEDAVIVAGVDMVAGDAPYPVYTHPTDCKEPVDVIVDFSNPAALEAELDYAMKNHIPAVICTTGLREEQVAALHKAAESIPVFFSGNMSLGVSVLAALTKKAAAILGDGFDIEIIEMHHNQKLDAPSGTALMLANAAKEGVAYEPDYIYDRHQRRQKRDPREIGISAVRGGTIVGEHQVIFAGKDEVINLTHRAQSREIFAVGALRAARYLLGKPAGMYNMEDLVNEV